MPSYLPFSGALVGAGLEVEQLGLEPASIRDADTAIRGLTYFTMPLALLNDSIYVLCICT